MRTFVRAAFALLLTAGLTVSASAQDVGIDEDNSGAGTTSAEFLLFGAGARGMAIGNAFSAMVRDVESLYYNPAGLPLMDDSEAMLSIMPHHADTDYIWAGAATPISNGEFGIGLSIANFGFGDQPLYDEEDPQGEGGLVYDVSQTVVGLSFAHAFIDRFTGGLTLKYINDQLGQTDANGFAVDVGTNFHSELNDRPIAFSFVIQNLGPGLRHTGTGLDRDVFPEGEQPGTPVTPVDPSPAQFTAFEYELPVVFRVGLAYDVVSSETNRLSLLTQFNEINNNDPSFGFSGEYEWSPVDIPLSAALRGSYEYQPDNNATESDDFDLDELNDTDSSADLDGLTLGGGLDYGLGEDYLVSFDYAYRHFGVLGSSNVFSVGFGW